jgi:hypothetical protein
MQVEPHSFERVREGLARKYANCNIAPEKHATYLRLRALKHLWHLDDILLQIRALTPADLQASPLPHLWLPKQCELEGGGCLHADAIYRIGTF